MNASKVVSTLLGLVFVALGSGFLYIELRLAVVHTPHVYVFAGLAVFGALIVVPETVLAAIKTVGSVLPWRRNGNGNGGGV